MNINRLVFTIEDVMNTCSRFAVSADFVDYCDIRTVIGLDKQDLELRPWLEALYRCHPSWLFPFCIRNIRGIA